MSVQLDAKPFHQRAKKLLDYFKSDPVELNDAQSLLFLVGASDGELSYQKSIALQNWWIGYEFPETLTLVLKNKIVFLTSVKKGAILETLREGQDQVDFEILTRTKDEAQNKVTYKKVIDMIPAGKVGTESVFDLGVITKEKPEGKLVSEWQKAVDESGKEMEMTDVSVGMAVLFAAKDKEELENTRMAADLTSLTMKNYFVDHVTNLIDAGKKVTHEQLSESLEKTHADERRRERIKPPRDVNWKLVEWCYPPIIQSGGKYDLRPSAQSNSSSLHGGTIVCSFGVRYKSYCTNIARTILINPEKEKEENYQILVNLQKYVMGLLKPNAICSEIFESAVKYIESKKPSLKDHFVKNLGFGTGIEFRESNFVISSKNNRPLINGMIVNLTMGFQNLEISSAKDPRNKVYSLFLGDTVQVTESGAVLLTDYDTDLKSITYTFGDEEDDDTKANEVIPKRGAILETQLRKTDERQGGGDENRRKAHQAELFEKLQMEGLKKYAGGKDGVAEKAVATFKKFECYRKDTPLPKNVAQLKIIVDKRAETVLLPIYGQSVPFHISLIKNVSKSEEGDSVLLRFNFITPGQATGKKEAHAYEDEKATFVRSLSFRSNEIHRFTDIAKEIMDLKKEITKRESERAEKAGLVEQDALIEIKGRRPARLPDVFARPGLEGKRFSGDLEIHVNGLRYQSSIRSDQKVDILFSNIKHLFFQPCDGEMIILIHIHLNDPIMIGKKKTKDVQFYRDVTDASFDETGNRRRRTNYGDEDELAQEQEERKHRQQLNREFQQFSDRVSESSKKMVDVDVPMRDLGFQGVPHRQLVLLQPTTECLVHLSDTPFLVITVSDVEIAHLERVQFGLKNFDLVFIFKDYSRPVVHVNTIPVNQLESVKDWLDSVEIPFTEGPVNLSWLQIMKTITDDPKSFFEEAGGWTFLSPDGDDDGSMVESSESEFEAESMESEESSDSASSDESDFSDSGSGSGSGSGEEESEGEDWDELERKAMQSDRKKDSREEDYDSGRKPSSAKQRRR